VDGWCMKNAGAVFYRLLCALRQKRRLPVLAEIKFPLTKHSPNLESIKVTAISLNLSRTVVVLDPVSDTPYLINNMNPRFRIRKKRFSE
jgi:hypothetical protein